MISTRSLLYTLLFICPSYLGLFLGGCTSSEVSKTSHLDQSNRKESTPPLLGQVQAALTLPDGHDCFLFSALDSDDLPLFEVDIEFAQIRNHQ